MRTIVTIAWQTLHSLSHGGRWGLLGSLVPALWLAALPLTAGAQTEDSPRVDLRAAVAPPGGSDGAGTSLAISASVEPGWHIYWDNPGDTGLATLVSLEAPAGFEIGAPLAPGPDRFVGPGGVVGYGFAGEATWTVELSAPPEASRAPIDVAVDWVACTEDSCVPGRSDLTLELRRGPHGWTSAEVVTSSHWEALTARSPRCVDPVAWTPGEPREGFVSWQAVLDGGGLEAFFPGPGLQPWADVVMLRAGPGHSRVEVLVAEPIPDDLSSRLAGVARLGEGAEARFVLLPPPAGPPCSLGTL
jgi:hypothetical protein